MKRTEIYLLLRDQQAEITETHHIDKGLMGVKQQQLLGSLMLS